MYEFTYGIRSSTSEPDFSVVIPEVQYDGDVLVDADVNILGVNSQNQGPSLKSSQLVEVRAYGIGSTDHVTTLSNENQQEDFIVLGTAIALPGSGSSVTRFPGSWMFQKYPPVRMAAMKNGIWRFQLYDVSTAATVLVATIGGVQIAFRVRGIVAPSVPRSMTYQRTRVYNFRGADRNNFASVTNAAIYTYQVNDAPVVEGPVRIRFLVGGVMSNSGVNHNAAVYAYGFSAPTYTNVSTALCTLPLRQSGFAEFVPGQPLLIGGVMFTPAAGAVLRTSPRNGLYGFAERLNQERGDAPLPGPSFVVERMPTVVTFLIADSASGVLQPTQSVDQFYVQAIVTPYDPNEGFEEFEEDYVQ